MEPSSVIIIVSRVFSRRKRFRAFPQPASVPRKRPFPESFRVFPRPSVYPFVKEKPVFTRAREDNQVVGEVTGSRKLENGLVIPGTFKAVTRSRDWEQSFTRNLIK